MIWNIIFDILGSFFSKVEETQEEGGPPPAGPTIHYTSIHCQASVHILSTLFFSFSFWIFVNKERESSFENWNIIFDFLGSFSQSGWRS